MRLLHGLAKTHAYVRRPNLSVGTAGLIPVMALAERAGLGGLVAGLVRPGRACGVNADLKVPCLVAGMAAGAGPHRGHGCATRRTACIARVAGADPEEVSVGLMAYLDP